MCPCLTTEIVQYFASTIREREVSRIVETDRPGITGIKGKLHNSTAMICAYLRITEADPGRGSVERAFQG